MGLEYICTILNQAVLLSNFIYFDDLYLQRITTKFVLPLPHVKNCISSKDNIGEDVSITSFIFISSWTFTGDTERLSILLVEHRPILHDGSVIRHPS